jgi:ribonuclease HI
MAFGHETTMSVPAPHFLLFSSARHTRPPHESNAGQWHFVIRASDGTTTLEAEDAESEVSRDRLELLAIVRGLEALEQPSSVTIITSSRYIQRGLLHGLVNWRENGWQWERFGALTPVKNADLWRRIDHAMRFHAVRCRVISAKTTAANAPAATDHSVPPPSTKPIPRRGLRQRLRATIDNWSSSLADLWPKTRFANLPTC